MSDRSIVSSAVRRDGLTLKPTVQGASLCEEVRITAHSTIKNESRSTSPTPCLVELDKKALICTPPSSTSLVEPQTPVSSIMLDMGCGDVYCLPQHVESVRFSILGAPITATSSRPLIPSYSNGLFTHDCLCINAASYSKSGKKHDFIYGNHRMTRDKAIIRDTELISWVPIESLLPTTTDSQCSVNVDVPVKRETLNDGTGQVPSVRSSSSHSQTATSGSTHNDVQVCVREETPQCILTFSRLQRQNLVCLTLSTTVPGKTFRDLFTGTSNENAPGPTYAVCCTDVTTRRPLFITESIVTERLSPTAMKANTILALIVYRKGTRWRVASTSSIVYSAGRSAKDYFLEVNVLAKKFLSARNALGSLLRDGPTGRVGGENSPTEQKAESRVGMGRESSLGEEEEENTTRVEEFDTQSESDPGNRLGASLCDGSVQDSSDPLSSNHHDALVRFRRRHYSTGRSAGRTFLLDESDFDGSTTSEEEEERLLGQLPNSNARLVVRYSNRCYNQAPVLKALRSLMEQRNDRVYNTSDKWTSRGHLPHPSPSQHLGWETGTNSTVTLGSNHPPGAKIKRKASARWKLASLASGYDEETHANGKDESGDAIREKNEASSSRGGLGLTVGRRTVGSKSIATHKPIRQQMMKQKR